MRYLQVPATLTPPNFFYTLKGNPFSEKVIEKLRELKKEKIVGCRFEVLDEIPQEEDFRTYSIALFDSNECNRNFTPNPTKKPSWANSYWSVAVRLQYEHRAADCANQVFAWFKRAVEELNRGMLPWGYPKKGTVILNGNIPEVGYGQVRKLTLQSNMGPFQLFDHSIQYPEKVIEALKNIYARYNAAFMPLVDKNREWKTDYQFCFSEGITVNCAVQIDMRGLDQLSLDKIEEMSIAEVEQFLLEGIFEVENSLAMYQLLCKAFENGHASYFEQNFRMVLDGIRKKHNKKIALLAVTNEKYEAMLKSEFGKNPGDMLNDEEVFELSGFDKLFGPQDFLDYISKNGEESEYLLYVRSSDPVRALKDPKEKVEHPLLGDERIRRIVKAYSLTMNIDQPGGPFDGRINDTKEYAEEIGVGCTVSSVNDLNSLPYSTSTLLRAKPLKGTYGCYGHVSGYVGNSKFEKVLAENLKIRGKYLIQPELRTPIVKNNDLALTYIDRVFLGHNGSEIVFIGGFRNMMPLDSEEARQARIHGNEAAIWAEIISFLLSNNNYEN